MLHLLVALAATTAVAGPDAGVPTRDLLASQWAPLTPEARAKLAKRLSAQIVEVRRSRPNLLISRVEARIAGWWAGKGRVVTSSWVVQGWPASTDDVIEVRAPDGRWLPAAVGLDDGHIGFAVLDVPSLAAPSVRPSERAPAEGALVPNVLLFCAWGTDLRVLPVGAPGADHKAYYFKIAGAPVPVGTPLFDARGGFVSVVALPSGDPQLAGYALPTRASQALFERWAEWR